MRKRLRRRRGAARVSVVVHAGGREFPLAEVDIRGADPDNPAPAIAGALRELAANLDRVIVDA